MLVTFWARYLYFYHSHDLHFVEKVDAHHFRDLRGLF